MSASGRVEPQVPPARPARRPQVARRRPPAPEANPTPSDPPGRSQCTSAWAALLSRVSASGRGASTPWTARAVRRRPPLPAGPHHRPLRHRHRSPGTCSRWWAAHRRGPPSASQGELFIDDGPFDEAFVLDTDLPDESYLVDSPSDDGLPLFDIDTAPLG